MTVENTATPAADEGKTAANAADSSAASAATAENEDLLGNDNTDDTASNPDGEKAGDQKADEGDDLLEGKVSEEEEGEGESTAAPEDYEFKIPEGYELDAELADISKPAFKEAGLSQEQAQALVEKLGPQILTKLGERQAAQWKDIQKGWAKESKSDPEIFDLNTKSVRPEIAVARSYFGPEFTAAIKMLGGNNNPAVLKALAKVGKALGEDGPGFGKPNAAPKTREERLYPNDQPKTKE
jgi:hypothetical protein